MAIRETPLDEAKRMYYNYRVLWTNPPIPKKKTFFGERMEVWSKRIVKLSERKKYVR